MRKTNIEALKDFFLKVGLTLLDLAALSLMATIVIYFAMIPLYLNVYSQIVPKNINDFISNLSSLNIFLTILLLRLLVLFSNSE